VGRLGWVASGLNRRRGEEMAGWPWAIDGKLGRTAAWSGPVLSFSFIPSIFQYSNTFQLVKYEKITSRVPKIFKLGNLIDQFKWDMFHVCPDFQFSLDCEL
jgi:hypothetical protein